MITDRDITKLKTVFVTKEEHADLRVEVGELRDELYDFQEDTHNRFEQLEAKMDAGFDRIEVKIDKFLGTVDALQVDNAAGAQILYRHSIQIRALADGTGITLPEE